MLKIIKATAAALISGLLVGGACVTAWSATSTNQSLTVAEAVPIKGTGQPVITVLGSPEFPLVDSRPDALRNCKPGQMYSAHDVVGDPQACIMGSVSGFGVDPAP